MTEQELEIAINRLNTLLKRLVKGQTLKLENHPYPIAMGEDGSVGYLYNGHIPSPVDLPSLLKFAFEMPTIVPEGGK